MEISGQSLTQLLKSFPVTDLAYEIIKNESCPTQYNVEMEMSIHIPIGPKYFAWFYSTGLYLMELDRQKRITSCRFHKMAQRPQPHVKELFYGTILYGTWVTSVEQFVMEDIYYYKGQKVSMCFEKDKWHLIFRLLSVHLNNMAIVFRVPPINVTTESLPPHLFHHVQFRHLQKTSLYVNYIMKPSLVNDLQPKLLEKPYFKSCKKPQYQERTVFKMVWDPTGNDLYKLYTFGPNKSFIFYDYVLVQDIRTSYELKQMFGQSRVTFRRNQNLDYMEESDDEEEIVEKEVEEKTRTAWVRCQFDFHFKKWIPCERVKDFSRVVHISQL